MKERELRKHATCSVCGKPIGHTGLPLFWTVRVRRWGIDMKAVNRQSGLTAMLGGSAGLAQAMGTDEDMASELMDVEITMCESCAMGGIGMMALEVAERETDHE